LRLERFANFVCGKVQLRWGLGGVCYLLLEVFRVMVEYNNIYKLYFCLFFMKETARTYEISNEDARMALIAGLESRGVEYHGEDAYFYSEGTETIVGEFIDGDGMTQDFRLFTDAEETSGLIEFLENLEL